MYPTCNDRPAPAAHRLPRRAALLPAVLTALLLSFLSGCTSVPHTSVSAFGGADAGAAIDAAPMPDRIRALTREIQHLSPTIDPKEAADCAATAVRYAVLLADTYGIHQPVELHNVLVNLGIKHRGLCYQLADDLDAELQSRHYRTLLFRRGVAWEDDLWNEHNCVVVSAPGQPFDAGLVLDAWRLAPVLRWAPVKQDHYPWVPKVYADEQLTTTPTPPPVVPPKPPSPYRRSTPAQYSKIH